MDNSKDDLDGAVVRYLVLLTSGNMAEFRESEEPPPEVRRWLSGANIKAYADC